MWIAIAAVSGALAVALGAFGAHGLAGRVGESQLATWSTAAHYHLVHSLALLALGLYAQATARPVSLPAALFLAGVVLFSGSLYGLVLTGQRWLGPITPLGGLCFLAAWLSLWTVPRG